LNAKRGDTAGTHLRFNNPTYGALVFTLPTTGKENILAKYGSARSGSGAHWQFVQYTTDGTNYVLYDTMRPSEGTNQKLFVVDLRKVTAANNNPNFKIKITFGQGGGGLAGNNRIDNFSLESIAPDLSGLVTGVRISPKDVLLEVGNTQTLLATISPADAIDKSLTWSSSKSSIAKVDSLGKVTAVGEGTAKIYVTTNDGNFMDSSTIIVTVQSTLDLIYYWHFNNFNPTVDVKEINGDFSLLNNVTPKLTYTLTPDANVVNERDIDRYSPGSLLNSQKGEVAGGSARVRNPSVNRSLVFDMPTTGVSNLIFSLTVQRSGNGMLTNTIEYSVDGTTFISTGLTNNVKDVVDFEVWQIHTYDFTTITAANNNPKFKIRITWKDANASNTSGNNRYDNITLMGDGKNVSVSKVQILNPVTVHPNPSNGMLTISASNNQPIQYVSIIDIKGKVVLDSQENVLDLSSLDNGIYFVMTLIDGVTFRNKIIVSK